MKINFILYYMDAPCYICKKIDKGNGEHGRTKMINVNTENQFEPNPSIKVRPDGSYERVNNILRFKIKKKQQLKLKNTKERSSII